MQFDAVVIGGGPVGAATALELESAGLNVGLLEARDAHVPATDARPLALSHGSRLILDRLGVWDHLAAATPINRIHVSHRGRFGRTVLTAAEARLPALGYVLDYTSLAAVLEAALELAAARGRLHVLRGTRVLSIAHDSTSAHVHFETSSGTGDCYTSVVAVADGRAEAAGVDVEVIDYGQSALSAWIETEPASSDTAYERFTPEGPLALLPCGEGYAVVWAVQPARAEWLCSAAPADFLAELQKCFGTRAGRFVRVNTRTVHRIALRLATSTTAGRAALIGNSAQTLHPVAGQGLNLGLRDAWELAREIRKRGSNAEDLLHAYGAKRRVDRIGGVAFTHALVKVFSNDWISAGLARGVGLTLLDLVPPAKDFIVRRMVFGARG